MAKTIFKDAAGNQYTSENMIDEIIRFMRDDSEAEYNIALGTDTPGINSTKDTDRIVDFVTAIVIHRIGKGARYFYKREDGGHINSLKDRITKEALTSISLANAFIDRFETAITAGEFIPNYSFEIHLDMGEVGQTKTMLKDLVGMIRANNFEVKIKPASYAASCVADKHT